MKTKTITLNLISLAAFCVFLLLALGSAEPNAGSSTFSTASSTQQESPRAEALRSMKLDFKWGTTGFGNIMEADFTIQNPTSYKVKDIEITCTHFAASGTKIDSNTRTIYEIFAPKSKRVIKKFNMGFIHSQAKSSNCRITDLVVE